MLRAIEMTFSSHGLNTIFASSAQLLTSILVAAAYIILIYRTLDSPTIYMVAEWTELISDFLQVEMDRNSAGVSHLVLQNTVQVLGLSQGCQLFVEFSFIRRTRYALFFETGLDVLN